MRKQEEIFTNYLFNLKYTTETIETQYQDELYSKLSSSNTNLYKLNLMFIITLTIFVLFFFKIETQKETLALLIPIISIISARTITKKYSNHNVIQITSGVLYYFIYSIFIIVIRKVLIHLYNINALLLVSLYYLDLASKLIIICSQLIDHNKFCKVSLYIFIIIQFLYFYFRPFNDAVVYWLLENTLILIEVYFSNWICKLARYTFYCVDKVYIYHNWYRDLLK